MSIDMIVQPVPGASRKVSDKKDIVAKVAALKVAGPEVRAAAKPRIDDTPLYSSASC